MKPRGARWLIAWGLTSLCTATICAAPPPTGLQRDVVFGASAPLARNGELLHRLVSPFHVLDMQRAMAGNPSAMQAFPLAPARQHFALYVPASPAPAAGDALLVFVPPWNDARIPTEWIPVLDRNHVIFVTAAGSGNDADVLNRRDPLALLAAYNVMQRYHVDPARVYVGGFSGGSRVALRLALAYPDLFRGALLDAGSDPIGTAQVPLPSAPLLHRFQQSSRIVFLTGNDDTIRQAQRARSDESLQHWCAFDTDSVTLLHAGHVLADAAGFAQALAALFKPVAPDLMKIDACRARNAAALAQELGNAESLIHSGHPDRARRALTEIDARFGGLAAPRSIELLRALDAHREPH
ncbi:MAG TPA: PHB depolymerase family esterase [Rhodanobacteraceae bacterium]|jgi:pimeloyl-ACP methyl ester carboxylesterase|nr:PHB depolymerase family esterase [Rhodanobacteraceae bacterium]